MIARTPEAISKLNFGLWRPFFCLAALCKSGNSFNYGHFRTPCQPKKVRATIPKAVSKQLLTTVIVCIAILQSFGCKKPIGQPDKPVMLKFSLTIDKEICQQNKYKRTPQFAIWLENPETGEIRTVCVTQKTAKGNWGRNIKRPVSLPYWVSKWNREAGTSGDPTAETPAADAVTSATPQEGFSKSIEVPSDSKWDCFIEVNVSGDHNETFPQSTPDGKKDPHSNGQPSIIYKGTIKAVAGNTSKPELIGRTDQFEVDHKLIADTEGITTAKQLFSRLEVKCISRPE